jgi:hypothetical protein
MAEPGELAPTAATDIERYGPYGPAGRLVWGCTRYALGGFRPYEPPSASAHRYRHWSGGDYQSFDAVIHLERESHNLRMSAAVPLEQRQEMADRLHGSLTMLREALPYHEAERRWLVDTYIELEEREDLKVPFVNSLGNTVPIRPPFRTVLHHFRKSEGEIVSAGIRQMAQGHDLARRWWSWHRQTDEFTDQDSREIAHAALRELRGLLIPLNRKRKP